MREIFDAEILDRSMWNIYQTMKDDNFQIKNSIYTDSHRGLPPF